MPDRVPVLIAGAGPVGLSLALGLARCGVPSIVVEKNPSTSEKSRAPGIWTRTLEILDGWGVADEFISAGTFLSHVGIWTVGDPEPRVEISFDSLQGTTPHAGILILSQSKTEAILAGILLDEPLADVRFSSELLDWSETADGVAARIGTPGGEVSIEASYLVGCDGAHSRVRERLGFRLRGKTYAAHVALADVQLAGGEIPWPRVGTGDGPLIGLRLEEELWRIVAIGSAAAKDRKIDDEELDVWVRSVFGDVDYKRVWTSTFDIHSRICDSFRRNRVLLAGDAAHLNSPAGGQGMNSGIQDAHNLAWKLARALSGGDADKLLSSYDVERQDAVRRYVNRTTDVLTRGLVEGGSWSRFFFTRFARAGLQIAPLRGRILRRMTMLDIRYRDSPLFPVRHRLAGRRAPNCAVRGIDGVERLHELLRTAPCLLWLGYEAAPWEFEALALRQEALTRETAPALFDELDIAAPLAMLIRPDGFIGLAVENPTLPELARYLSAALGDA
jgi:2-polyprenyl-6-methoxyphenol hydroxylase-like FAD-dependent oxidoreductase